MNSILIIAPNWIGDAVMTQPLLARLKTLYPSSRIDVLASSWVAPIYRACTEVNEVIEAKFEHKQLQWGLRKQLARTLASKSYQACYVLPNSLKSALIPWLANIPFRISYRGEHRYGFINHSKKNPSKKNRPPMVDHYLALSEILCDSEIVNPACPLEPKLNVSLKAKQAVEEKLHRDGISADSIYVMCPGAEYGPTKRWPSEHFAELTKVLLTKNSTSHIILLGSKSDHELGLEIMLKARAPNNLHNWCGNTSLDEAIALLSLCKAVISNDSGLMHIAAALKTPQIAIFGSSDPAHTPPLSAKAKVLWLNLPCSPCHKRECPLGHLQCLKDILPGQVLDTLDILQ